MDSSLSAWRWSSPYLRTSRHVRRARWSSDRSRTRLRGVTAWARPVIAIGRAAATETRARVVRALPGPISERATALEAACEVRMAEAIEELQRAYFAYPWLGWVTLDLLAKTGRLLSLLTRASLRTAIALGLGDPREHRSRLERIPCTGYEAFMAAWLATTEAAGVFRAGDVHVTALPSERQDPPAPTLRRLDVPHTLADSLEDIDDMTWAATAGSLIKIIRVADHDGWRSHMQDLLNRVTGQRTRWIIELPGTDHLSLATTTNPADPQANLRESIGLPSNQRKGVIRAVLAAMTECGITDPQDIADQDILFIGHSQGALIAMALAADPDTPFPIRTIVSAGGPIGRMSAPEGTRVLALRHLQDPIPLFGGLAGEVDPAVVVYERSLAAPATGVLYFAHASGTYAETARQAEEYKRHVPHSTVSRMLTQVERYYPSQQWYGREPGRVFFYEITQDVLSDTDLKEGERERR